MYRLAERLGMTVARLGVEMDSEEFTHWHALSAMDDDRRKAEQKDRADEQRRAESARKAKEQRDADASLGDRT